MRPRTRLRSCIQTIKVDEHNKERNQLETAIRVCELEEYA